MNSRSIWVSQYRCGRPKLCESGLTGLCLRNTPSGLHFAVCGGKQGTPLSGWWRFKAEPIRCGARSQGDWSRSARRHLDARLRLRPFADPSRQPGGLQEARELGRRLILRDRVQFLEGAREGVRQAPHGPGLEILELWMEVEVMNPPG